MISTRERCKLKSNSQHQSFPPQAILTKIKPLKKSLIRTLMTLRHQIRKDNPMRISITPDQSTSQV